MFKWVNVEALQLHYRLNTTLKSIPLHKPATHTFIKNESVPQIQTLHTTLTRRL